MKKLLTICGAILIIVPIIFLFLDWRGEYAAQKAIWGVNKLFSKTAQHAQSTPDVAIEALANKYRKFIKNFPESKITPKAHLLLGNVYLLKNNFDAARKEYGLLIQKYPHNGEIQAEAHAAIAKTYEMQEQWDKAISIYRTIIKEHPLTGVGFTSPLYIARFYQTRNQPDKAREAYREATAFYEKYAKEHGEGLNALEYNSLRLLSICHINQEKWESAVDTLGKILLEYPSPQTSRQSILAINNIAAARLKNLDVPIGIYKEFIKQHPDHQLNELMNKMIADLENLKKENVVFKIKEE